MKKSNKLSVIIIFLTIGIISLNMMYKDGMAGCYGEYKLVKKETFSLYKGGYNYNKHTKLDTCLNCHQRKAVYN